MSAGLAAAPWLHDPRWPDLVHPVASAIDTPLPMPPALPHIVRAGKPRRVAVDAGPQRRRQQGHPKESIAAWHDRLGLTDDP